MEGGALHIKPSVAIGRVATRSDLSDRDAGKKRKDITSRGR